MIADQLAVVVASCGEDQTMIERARSDFIVRLEHLVGSDPARSIDELRAALEADTPDCERPVVWTNAAARWPSEVVAVPRPSGRC